MESTSNSPTAAEIEASGFGVEATNRPEGDYSARVRPFELSISSLIFRKSIADHKYYTAAKINPCFYLDIKNGNIASRNERTADLKHWRYWLSGLIAQRFGETFPFGDCNGRAETTASQLEAETTAAKN